MDIKAIDGARGRLITQAFQAGPQERRPAITIVQETQFWVEREAFPAQPLLQFLDLTGDRALLGLTITGDTSVNSHPNRFLVGFHEWFPPVPVAKMAVAWTQGSVARPAAAVLTS